MRRLILWIISILITFSLGVGLDRLVSQRSADEVPVKPRAELVTVDLAEYRNPTPVLVPTVPLPEVERARNLLLDYDREKFDPYGVFYIMGSPPQGFKDFECLELRLFGFHDETYPGNIQIYSRLGNNGSEDALAKYAWVTERRLLFKTGPSSSEGVEYRFEGEFLVQDFKTVAGKNKAALRGTLTKSKYGRVLAEQTISFRMEYLGC